MRVKLKILRVAALILLGAGFVASFRTGHIGFTEVATGGGTKISAGSDPILLAWAAVAIVLFVVLMCPTTCATVAGTPTLKRRAIAFFADLWFSVASIITVAALLPYGLRQRRTGHFVWHFERNYAVGTDYLILPLVLGHDIDVPIFRFPAHRGKQTLGSFLMRLKVTPPFGDDGRFTLDGAMRRTGYELLGLVRGEWAGKGFRDGQGTTWWDRKSNCRVVLVQYE